MSEGASVKVAVRVRPFNQREIDKKSKLCIAMPSRETTIINQPETDAPKTFTFDFSYWSHDGFKKDEKGVSVPDGDTKYASQEIVFQDLGKLVLDNAFDGFNCSLFAYGQTGAGKSYSMVGYGADRGIIPMVCDKMFERTGELSKTEPNTTFQVTVTMLEIYNEQVRDLLNPKASAQKDGLKVREKKGIGVYVEGLVPRPVANYAEIEARMEEGTKNRTIGSTKMNATSSRAHTVFGILFTRKAKDPGSGQEAETTSKINLVDLAGSERADSTGATGDRLKEGCAINQSLSALGNVISTLADNAGNPKNQKFVPYRNSVLTRLLQDALGGNSKTIMIAALSPADVNYDETLSTLRYADRAKKIKNSVVKNENPTDRIIRLLKEENDRLKKLLEGKGVDLNAAMAATPGGGAGGADVDAMKKKWEEEKKENDRIIAEMKKSWEEKVKEAQATAKSAGPDSGTSAVLAKTAAASRLPHIVLLNEDPQLSGNLVYMFKIGTTKIGKRHSDGAAEKQDIELTGLNVLKQHAVVENDASAKVSIEPLNKSRTFVNGELVKAKRELKQGDRLVLGNNQHVFKFVNPATPGFKEDDGNVGEDEYNQIMKEFSEKQGLNKSSMSAEVQKLEEEEKKTRKELEDKLKAMEDMLKRERENARKDMESVRSVILKKGALSDADKASLQKLEAEFNDKVGKSDAQLKERKEMEAQMLQEQLKRKRENQKVESQLSALIPLVNEVNQMAEEMQKPVRFEAKLIIKPTATINFSTLDEIQHLKKIDVVVRVHSLANGNVWTWVMEKFENRLFMMRDMYQAFQDFGPQDVGQKDPFWDPPEAIEIGKAYVYLKALSQLVEIENEFAIIDHAGEERGWLRVEINPEGLNGEEKEYLGTSDELLEKSVVFNVKVPYARGLPAKYGNGVHVVFKFNGETCETEQCDSKTADPKWKFAAKIKLEKVEPKHIKYLLTEACVFEIRGFTDNSRPPTAAGAVGGAAMAGAGAGGGGAAAGALAPALCPICEERPTAIKCTDCEEKKQFYCGTCWPVHHKSAAKKTHKKLDVTPGTAGAAGAAAAATAGKDEKTRPGGAAGGGGSSLMPPATTNAALLCDWCSEQRPTVTCVECNSAFCDTCNGVKHKSKTLQAHNRQPFASPMGPPSPGPAAAAPIPSPVASAPAAAAAAAAAPAGGGGGGAGLCQNCEEHAATIACEGCEGKKFCDTCWAANHKSAAKKAHPKKQL